MEIVSTLLLLPPWVTLCPSSFSPALLSLPPQPRPHLHRRSRSRSSHPLQRSHSPASPPPIPLRAGGFPPAPTAPPSALESTRGTTSLGLLWLKDTLLWGGMGVPPPPHIEPWPRRPRLCPAAPQRAPLTWAVPPLWQGSQWDRAGGSGTVV